MAPHSELFGKKIRKLGSGNYGTAFLYELQGIQYALKVINLQKMNERRRKRKLFDTEDEVQALRQIGCSDFTICLIDDQRTFYDSKNMIYYIAMSYGGEDLSKIRDKNNLTYSSYKKIKKHLIKGVNYIHSKGVAHLDIKPGNISISNGVPKYIDFGLHCKTAACDPAGTRGYMSPTVENAFNQNKSFSFRDAKLGDHFSLRITLCKIFNSIHPSEMKKYGLKKENCI